MKKIYTAALAATLLALNVRAEEKADTIMAIKNATSALLTETPAGVHLQINGTDADPEFQSSYSINYDNSRPVHTSQSFSNPLRTGYDGKNTVILGKGLHFGFCGAAGLSAIEPGRSFEIGVDELIVYERKFSESNWLNVGMGINWRNYRTTGAECFLPTADRGVALTAYPDEAVETKGSRLKIFSLGFPISYTWRTPLRLGKCNLFVNGGVVLNWNSHASLLTKWKESDGREAAYTSDHVGQRKFTVDLMARVSFGYGIGLYFKYSPMSPFLSGRGPQFHQFSTGINIGI